MKYFLSFIDYVTFRELSTEAQRKILSFLAHLKYHVVKVEPSGSLFAVTGIPEDSPLLSYGREFNIHMTEHGLLYNDDGKAFLINLMKPYIRRTKKDFISESQELLEKTQERYGVTDDFINQLPEDILALFNQELAKVKAHSILRRYSDAERPVGVCYDCHLPYNEFPDFIIKDEHWELINPTYHEGAGILCPTCIANRLDKIGLWYPQYSNTASYIKGN